MKVPRLPNLFSLFNGNTLKIYAAVMAAAITLLGANSICGIANKAPRISVGEGNTGTVVINASPFSDPVDVVQLACGAEKVQKTQSLLDKTWSYTADQAGDNGGYMFLRWTDDEFSRDRMFVEINGESGLFDVDSRAIDCLKDRAKIATPDVH